MNPQHGVIRTEPSTDNPVAGESAERRLDLVGLQRGRREPRTLREARTARSRAPPLTGLASCPCQARQHRLVPDGPLALGGYASWEPGLASAHRHRAGHRLVHDVAPRSWPRCYLSSPITAIAATPDGGQAVVVMPTAGDPRPRNVRARRREAGPRVGRRIAGDRGHRPGRGLAATAAESHCCGERPSSPTWRPGPSWRRARSRTSSCRFRPTGRPTRRHSWWGRSRGRAHAARCRHPRGVDTDQADHWWLRDRRRDQRRRQGGRDPRHRRRRARRDAPVVDAVRAPGPRPRTVGLPHLRGDRLRVDHQQGTRSDVSIDPEQRVDAACEAANRDLTEEDFAVLPRLPTTTRPAATATDPTVEPGWEAPRPCCHRPATDRDWTATGPRPRSLTVAGVTQIHGERR